MIILKGKAVFDLSNDRGKDLGVASKSVRKNYQNSLTFVIMYSLTSTYILLLYIICNLCFKKNRQKNLFQAGDVRGNK
jgi:hypothetical protein